MPSLNLSENDRAVLNSIFNPSQPLGENAFEEDIPELLEDQEDPQTPFLNDARALEAEAVRLAEAGDLAAALTVVDRAIDLLPGRPSGYNNRAQVHRLAGRDQDALSDLTMAVNLSSGKGRSGVQALCQRGLLYRKTGEDDLAREDFNKAASLGSTFAKNQLVEMNPYAALCNQMLGEVFAKLK
ncbi:tetratricopeptide repeat protein 36 [Ctenocephalides felis]|uniref:tetratricopeptide repeat protein 36 n=1 Tax=Ctenocephalides felis TaxID=7515 RepID=UPI000E6E11BB|nr:tetratricopeptide repeat protein 36 [Ctenocephalides felis]